MKKSKISLLPVILVMFIVFSFVALSFVGNIAKAATNDYNISEFSALPNNWELSSLCDTANVSTSYSNGQMVIKSTSTQSGSKYYGAMYRIATDRTYKDFTFEMQFKMENPDDQNRWMGIMYHTQQASNGKLIGYLMNFRSSGGSAASVVTPSLSFKDEAQIPSGVPLSDGEFHTIKIAMQGTTASHYIDNKLITQWDVTIKNNDLGGKPLTEGGFSLIVNRSTVTVRSVKISTEVHEAEGDYTLADTYICETPLIGAPTVVTDVISQSVLDSLKDDRKPSNAILHLNKNIEVVDVNGKVLGSFYDIYKSFNHKIIPIAYLSDEESAETFINYINNDFYILDLAVMSDKAAIVKKMREALPHVRGIVEYTQISNLYSIVKESTEAGAMTVVLQQKGIKAEMVAYLQARFKTVWVRSADDYYGDMYDCINSGCYGIVTQELDLVYNVLQSYEGGYTRNIFNVAHRALPQKFNENSLGGIEAAMRSGVTHLELDGRLTKDKHIVICHDDNISRVTNGNGNVKDLTLEQIRQYDLDLKQPTEKMPTLEEAIDLIKRLNQVLNTDVVLVFEIKDNQKDFVQCMKNILDGKDFYSNIVIITFEGTEHQLAELNRLVPQIPTANLDGISYTSFASSLPTLNKYNTGIDNISSLYSAEYELAMRDRGFIGWYWTFDQDRDVFNASKNGFVGVTNNSADCFGKCIRYVEGFENLNASFADVPAEGEFIPLNAVLYDGTESLVDGTVYHIDSVSEGWRVYASYTYEEGGNERTIYTCAINYYEICIIRPYSGSELALILGICIPVGVILIAAAIIVPVVLKKKRKN